MQHNRSFVYASLMAVLACSLASRTLGATDVGGISAQDSGTHVSSPTLSSPRSVFPVLDRSAGLAHGIDDPQ
jgi:hypothetical protein